MTPAVSVDGLVKTYGGRRVVDEVTFSVHAGSIVAILGPNGAGKTTTVEILEGYRRADGGAVRVLDLDPVADAARLRPRVGVMLQNPGLYPLATPRELIRLFARFTTDARPPDELIEQLGLSAVAGARIRTLSGGERQRLALALALVGRPELLVLDEPTAAMDPEARRDVRELIAGLRADGVTILLTTHDLGDVERLADRVVVLDRGRVVADGTPSSLSGGKRVLRFRLAGDVPADTIAAALEGLSGMRVERSANGWVRVLDALVTPALVAEVAARLAAADLVVAELRTDGGTLEERYLQLLASEAPE